MVIFRTGAESGWRAATRQFSSFNSASESSCNIG
jgi:hypothetical protein